MRINTYGENDALNAQDMQDILVRSSGASLISEPNGVFQIVPCSEVNRSPNRQTVPCSGPATSETVLHLIFLKHMAPDEVSRLMQQLVGGRATVISYAQASLLVIATPEGK
jgi:hypothetical protein